MIQKAMPSTCPVSRGVSAASFDATGLGVRTGQVCKRNLSLDKNQEDRWEPCTSKMFFNHLKHSILLLYTLKLKFENSVLYKNTETRVSLENMSTNITEIEKKPRIVVHKYRIGT